MSPGVALPQCMASVRADGHGNAGLAAKQAGSQAQLMNVFLLLARWLTGSVWLGLMLCLNPVWGQASVEQGAGGSSLVSAPDSVDQVAHCGARMLAVYAAPGVPDALTAATSRPTEGWQPVALPHAQPVQGSEGVTVWYRIDWMLPCDPSQASVALATEGFRLAGEVFSNDDLLWRDPHLTEPLSRSWNTPRYWLLPASSLREGVNTIWFRLQGVVGLETGLLETRLGTPEEIHPWYETRVWLQRSLPMVNIAVTGVLGMIFLFFWLLRPREAAAGWFAAMALAWNVFLGNFLMQSPWPLPDSYAVVRMVTVAFVLYTCAFCLFTWRFAEQRYPRAERLLWSLAAVVVVVLIVISPRLLLPLVVGTVAGCALVFVGNCVAFQSVAWRVGDMAVRLMAVCLLLYIPIAILDVLAMFQVIRLPIALTPWSAPITATIMASILAWRFTRHQNQIERFNQALADTVEQTREELTRTLQSRHALALRNARLEERLQIAHDLHDGMGSTLIRTIAQIEHARTPPDAGRMLSALKSMRDDLRQIIDSGTSDAAATLETPGQWLAPLRHRFVRLLEAMDIASSWQVPQAWPLRPSAAQCLALTRVVEEAMTNVIKHAAARQVTVQMSAHDGGLRLCIQDDGVGFDLDAVLEAGLSVGIHSMRRRIARVGGILHIESGPAGTQLCVHLAPAETPTVGVA